MKQRRILRAMLVTVLVLTLAVTWPALVHAATDTCPNSSSGEHSWKHVVTADCTHEGRDYYQCELCGTVGIANAIPALGHAWDNGLVTAEATCSAEGVKTWTCLRCGETRTEAIAKLAHTPVSIPAVEATCTAGGKTEGSKCSVCGTVLTAQQDTAALGHSWDSGAVTTAATCTAEGVKTYTCTRCGATYTEAIPKTAHTPVSIPAVAATCTAGGKTEGSKCSVCGTILTAQQDTAALGHSWDSGAVTTAATCTSAGVKTYTCTRCGAAYTEAIPMTAHTPVSIPAVAATCTAGGKTEGSKCSVCGTVLTAQQDTAALGHSWDSGAVTTAATCTSEGVKTWTCTRCGVTSTETISALGHRFGKATVVKEATCETPGERVSVCENDRSHTFREEIPAAGHQWDEGVFTVEPGYLYPGEKTYTCTVCGTTRTETVDRLTGEDGSQTTIGRLMRNAPPISTFSGDLPLVVTLDRTEGAVRRGESAELTAQVIGGTPPYSYEWRYITLTDKELADWLPGYDPGTESKTVTGGILPGSGSLEAVIEAAADAQKGRLAGYEDLTAQIAGAIQNIGSDQLISFITPDEVTWQHAKTVHSVNDRRVEGADGPTVPVTRGNCLYYCIVTDAEQESETSEEAFFRWMVRVADQSVDVDANGASGVNLWVKAADGLPDYQYMWFLAGEEEDEQLSAASAPVLPVDVDSDLVEKDIVCLVTDYYGEGVWSLPMRVHTLDVKVPESVYTKPGEDAFIQAGVSGGIPPYTYQWNYGYDMYWDALEPMEGADRDHISVAVEPGVVMRYSLTVTDDSGYSKTSNEVVVCYEPLTISQHPAGGELDKETGSLGLTVTVADGTPPYKYCLIDEDEGLPGIPEESNERTHTLTVEWPGTYSIMIEDAEGRVAVSSAAEATAPDLLHIVDYTKEAALKKPGGYKRTEKVELSVKAEGGTEPYTYEWLYSSPMAQEKGYTVIPGAVEASITVLPPDPLGAYMAVVTDAEGDSVSAWPIKVTCQSKAPWILEEDIYATRINPREDEHLMMFCRAVKWNTMWDDGLIYEWQMLGEDGWTKYPGTVQKGDGRSIAFFHNGGPGMNKSIRCVVTDPETGESTQSACIGGPIVDLTTHGVNGTCWEQGDSSGKLGFYFQGGVPPYTYTVTRSRTKDLNYSTIGSERTYKYSESYDPGSKMTVKEDYNVIDVYLNGVSTHATDCYKQSGFFWYYRRHAWTYTVKIEDAEGRTAEQSVTFRETSPQEYSKFLNIF